MRRLRTSLPAAARRFAVILVVAAGAAAIEPSRGADPQPYTVNLKPTGDSALDAALNGSSTLISLEKSAPVGGFALTERARQDDRPDCRDGFARSRYRGDSDVFWRRALRGPASASFRHRNRSCSATATCTPITASNSRATHPWTARI